jgi:putative sigma-54 modulation protein
MEIQFNFKNFEPSAYLKDHIQSRFEKLDKYLRNPETGQIQINLEVEKFRQIAEAILTADDLHLTAQDETQDMYATVDSILDKLEAQLRKYRDKQKRDKKRNKTEKAAAGPGASSAETAVEETVAAEAAPSVVETDMYEPKPMDVEEAVIQLQKSNYDFLVFFNAENNRVNVVYRRRNGDYGLIDPRM